MLQNKKLEMPFRPNVENSKDIGYFDKVFTDEVIKETPTKPISEDYEGFTYEPNRKIVPEDG